MKLLITSALVAGLALLSCKNESKTTSANTDTITTENTDKIPTPAPVDTLVAAPKSDTASTKTDSAKTAR